MRPKDYDLGPIKKKKKERVAQTSQDLKKQTNTYIGCFLSFLFSFKYIGYTGLYTGVMWGIENTTSGVGIWETQNMTRIAVEITWTDKINHLFHFK